MDNNKMQNEESVKNINNNVDESNDNEFDIIIDISDDYYEAFITIEYTSEEISVSREDILDALKKKNVVYGIKNEIINAVTLNPTDIYKLSIAQGERHENGKDGEIEYYFDMTNTKRPKMLSDGTADHKELNYVIKVKKDEILAKKILPTQCKDGMTVTGRTVRGKPGKHVDFKKGKNVIVTDDGIFLRASENGMLNFENNKVSVIKVLEINEDIGISTGNISFEGKIIVRGNVNTGYVLNSEDDIEIYGIVEGSEITARNIIIHKGVHNNARLISKGNITSNFMENCYAEAKGDIICDAIIHCKINCSGKVIATGKKGLIMGGSLNVRHEVIAKVIGSQIGSTTRIYVGIDEGLLMDLKVTKELVEETKSDIKKINKAIDILLLKKNQDPQKQLLLNKYLKTKDHYIEKIRTLEEKMKELCALIDLSKNSKISSNQIYSGTNIRINNSHYMVKNELSNVRLIKENGEVVLSPLV